MRSILKKIIIIPDSFKGSLTATEVCEIEKAAVNKLLPDCRVITIPAADGGEGTTDCFLYSGCGYEKITVSAKGPYGEPLTVYYARRGDTAVIESAMCAGIALANGRLNPAKTSTYGVGMLIKSAVTAGAKRLIIGLGGSCTNDGGAGMAAALGVKFLDNDGRGFLPLGENLDKINRIDSSAARELLDGVKITAMCDVNNPLCGKNGAAFVFAPQKGADSAMVEMLDKKLFAYAQIIRRELGINIELMPGAGAAGGMGGGLVALFGASLKSGIETVLDIVGFNSLLNGTDLVITGEGCLDSQSLSGKAISGIAKLAKAQNVPVIAVVGSAGEGADKAYNIGVSAVFTINRKAEPFEISRNKAKENLESTMMDLLRFYKISSHI